jgi:uncharacterized membrane protein YesL
MFEGLFGAFYRFGETVLLLLYVNFLWICFTLLGLIIFGFGPSTIAMFTVFRKWSMGESDVPVFTTFWESFRKDFWKANALGLTLLILACMLYVNLNYLELQGEWVTVISRYILLITAAIYVVMLVYIFPLYVHYENKFFVYFKNSILIAIYHPMRTIYVIAALLTLYYLFYVLPVFIFLIGPSLTSLVIMWIVYRTFHRIEYKQENLQEERSVS